MKIARSAPNGDASHRTASSIRERIRSETDSLFTQGLRSNRPLLGAVVLTFALQMATIYVPWLNPIFKTEPLAAWELGLCMALAALVFAVVELEKAWRRQRTRAAVLRTRPA